MYYEQLQSKGIKIINKILKNSDMEAIRLNESQILIDAWNSYIANYSKGWSFESAYSHAKADARNEAIRQMWKEQAEAKRKVEIEAERERFEASGMDLHTYTMTEYYNRGSGAYYGD